MRYVFFNIGDGCPQCVGESVYRFYYIFWKDMQKAGISLRDLHDWVNKSRELYSNKKNDVFLINVENGGKFIAKEIDEVKSIESSKVNEIGGHD